MRPLLTIVVLSTSLHLGFGQSSTSDSLEKLQRDLATNPRSSLTHFKIGQVYLEQDNYQEAANEFREALNGDLQPSWVEFSSHLNLGKIFALTGQRERASNEFERARRMKDNTWGALGAVRSLAITDRGKRVVKPVPVETREARSDEAERAELEGTVLLTGIVTEEGSARDMRVIRPLGLGLDEKALEAIQHWRFLPGTKDGRPVQMSTTVGVDFRLPSKQSRWHLIGAACRPAEEASRPLFLSTTYPLGAGVGPQAIEQAWIVAGIGRQGTATLSFDVDEDGVPVHFQVPHASSTVWGREAMNFVGNWRFIPGTKNVVPPAVPTPLSVPCTLDLVWGEKNLSSQALEWAIAELQAPSIPEPSPPPTENRTVPLQAAVVYKKSEPSYTEAARKARLEGTVGIGLVVAEDGTPRALHVIKSLGLGLDEKALEAVSTWLFRPSLLNGQPVPLPVVIEVNFRLDDSPGTFAQPHP